MDTRESNLAWIIAGVLLVLLIIVGYLWLSSRNDVDTVLENGRESIAAQREQIAKDCRGPEMDADACKEDLADLADILREFNEDFKNADVSASSSAAIQ